MRTPIARLLACSPFRTLQRHAEAVCATVEELGRVVRAYVAGEEFSIAEVSRLEHEADLLENQAIELIYRAEEMGDFARYHMLRVIFQMGEVIDHMENAGGRLRIMISR